MNQQASPLLTNARSVFGLALSLFASHPVFADVRWQAPLLPGLASSLPAGNPSIEVRKPAISRGRLLNALFLHPKVIGNPTLASTQIQLPKAATGERILLRFQTGISDGIPQNPTSLPDGILFSCRVEGEYKLQRLQKTAEWQPATVDLTEFTGRNVTIEFRTDPNGSDAYDWALIGEPVVEVVRPDASLLRTGLAWFTADRSGQVQLQGSERKPLSDIFAAHKGVNAIPFTQGSPGPVYISAFDGAGKPLPDPPRAANVAAYSPDVHITGILTTSILPTSGRPTAIRIRFINRGKGDADPFTIQFKSSSNARLPESIRIPAIAAGQTGAVDVRWVPSDKDVRKPIRFVATQSGDEPQATSIRVLPKADASDFKTFVSGTTRLRISKRGFAFVDASINGSWKPAGVLTPIGAGVSVNVSPIKGAIRLTKTKAAARLPALYAGDTLQPGAGGVSKVEAVLPGLEYLTGSEMSGSTRGFVESLADRSRPDYMQLTIPLAAITFGPNASRPDRRSPPMGSPDSLLGGGGPKTSDDDYTVALSWKDPRTASVTFQSPAASGAENHLLSVAAVDQGDWVDVRCTAGRTAAASIQWYRNYGPRNAPPSTFTIAGRHSLARKGMQLSFDGPTSQLRFTAGGTPEAIPTSVALLKWDALWNANKQSGDAADKALERLPVDSQALRGPSHIGRWELPFITGELARALPAIDLEMSALRRGQEPDGGFRLQQPDGPQDALGLRGDETSGTFSHSTWMLLRHARVTGDILSRDAGLAALDRIRNYQVPRGASMWEVPVYEPDMLASAWNVAASVEAFRVTNDTQWLGVGQYWAATALPFIYFTPDSNRPARLGSCIPTFGTTFFQHSWIGRPVPWQGLVLAWHFQDLAEQLRGAKRMTLASDAVKPQELDAIAKLLVVAAERTWLTSGPNTGLYPDTIENLITPKPAFIIPENLWLHTFRAQGQELAIQTQRQRGVTISTIAEIAFLNVSEDSLITRIGYKPGASCGVLLGGIPRRPSGITIDGTPLETAAWSYDADKDRVVLKVRFSQKLCELRMQY
ncbi:MAG: hypothetical protein ACKO14_09070 [Armatimonadota bacterium]